MWLLLLAVAKGKEVVDQLVAIPPRDWVSSIMSPSEGQPTVVPLDAEAGSLVVGDLFAPFVDEGFASPPYMVLRANGEEYSSSLEGLEVDDVVELLVDEAVSAVLRIEKLPSVPRIYRNVLGEALGMVEKGEWTAHVYIGADGSSALSNHTDVTDVAVYQLSGAKDWLRCDGDGDKASKCAQYDKAEMENLGGCAAHKLETGAGMFVPRRTVHGARSAGGVSAHVTVGIPDDDARRRLLCSTSSSGSCPAGTYGYYTASSCDTSCDSCCDSTGCDCSCDYYGCDSCCDIVQCDCSCDSSCDYCGGCTSCSAGTYAPVSGLSYCYTCPSGRTSSTGAISCYDSDDKKKKKKGDDSSVVIIAVAVALFVFLCCCIVPLIVWCCCVRNKDRKNPQRVELATVETGKNDTVVEVTVPEGVAPGQQIYVDTPDGERVEVRVPDNMGPGSTFQVTF
ncbi:hypothetical protein CTAYLR_003142 [Chrysophaeum taylorii]|uniref:JmjC domain-containing protein n=1 Tax=Chrysophaeum taylorii TaxID=2483200 RepID=A0AAD7XNB1_9STRA|nr:hypothetical protein CTAYLR_003142 [Chrysophaeum taylorii]